MLPDSVGANSKIMGNISGTPGPPLKVAMILLRNGLVETQVQVRHCILRQVREEEGNNTNERCGYHTR